MSTNSTTRIPQDPEEFTTYMQVTDDRQLLDDPDNPGNPLFEKYTWTPAQSTQWTSFRTQATAIFTQYNTAATVNTTIRNQMFDLMRQVNEYDHDRDTGHRLLEKVALNGNIADWEIFRIKRFTSLQDETPTPSGELGTTRPVISLRASAPGQHELSVHELEGGKSAALPGGVVFAEVMRYIGSADKPPASLIQFEQIGVAKRGIFLSKFDDLTFDPTKKYYAWYFVRYQSKTGELSLPSNELKILVDDSVTGSRGIVN